MIRVVVEPESIDVTPGDPVALTITVANDGTATEQVALRLVGVDPSWIDGLTDVTVDGGERVDVPITVTLPAGFPAGAQLIGIEGTMAGELRPAIGSLQLVVA